MKPIINVCVATYKRPPLLKQLLLSLASQQTNGEFDFNIIIADNDAQQSAESVVQELRESGLPVRYAVEPEQNISLARNKALSLADGDYVATIDDDEWASDDWLLHLYGAMIAYNVDVVNGPINSRFAEKTPRYIRECAVFHNPNPPTASSENYYCTTGNSLFRRKLIEDMTTPFKPELGRTGGEDTAFFDLLKQRGARMLWCREATVFEVIPAAKANLPWVLKRWFRYGLMGSTIHANRDINRKRMIYSHAKTFIKLSGLSAFYLFRGTFNYAHHTKGMGYLQSAAYRLGVLAFYGNFHYEEYRGK